MKIKEKAYKIDLTRIEEGYLYSPIWFRSSNRNKAKYELLREALWENMELKGGDDLTYINIPVVRDIENDKIIEDGVEMTYDQYLLKLEVDKHNKHLESFLEMPNVTHCYIKKRGNFYCKNYCGYTQYRENAGIYPVKDAVHHAKGITEISLVVADPEEHNRRIQEKIETLKNNIV